MTDSIIIGAIVSSIHETCESAVWNGIAAAAQAEGVELVTFVATSQDRLDSLDQHFEMVRDYAIRGAVDGIILSAGYAAEFTGTGFIERFSRSFGSIPMVNLSLEVEGLSCVIADNRSGIVDLISHMVMNHGLCRIGFIKGPEGHPEADDRYDAYKEGLALNRLPFDENLVCPGRFSSASGRAAIASLLQRGISFDGIVAVDDATAIGVVEELKNRGIHVPTEVAVAGFDDISEAVVTMPPLSTVRQPLFGIGARAVTELVSRIRRPGSAPVRVVLPARAVYRRSCGCFADYVQSGLQRCALHPDTGREDLIRRIAQLLSGVEEPTEFTPRADAFAALSQRIVEAFEEDICRYGIRSRFLDAIDAALFRLEKEPWCATAMESVLGELAAYPAFLFTDPVLIAGGHQLLQLASMLIQETGHNVAHLSAISDNAFHLRIRETCQRIIRTFEIDRLLHTLTSDLPELGIETFAIVLFKTTDGPVTAENWTMPEGTTLALARNGETGALTTRESAVPLPVGDLVPSEIRRSTGGTNTLFMPLFFKTEIMGYALFGLRESRMPFLYEDLRLHISIALKSALLKQDLEEQSLKDTLTGLFNRRGFLAACLHAMETAARSGTQLLMCYADLDGLQQVNAAHGHEAGDRLLRSAAQVMTDTFRRQDVIGRLGGDEFAVLCMMTTPGETEQIIADRFRRQIDRFNRTTPLPAPLSMTCGYATLDPAMSMSVEDLIRKADMLMMSGKTRTPRQ